MAWRSLKSSRIGASRSGEPIRKYRRETMPNPDLHTGDWRRNGWNNAHSNQGYLSEAEHESGSDRRQSVRSSDEASNDRGAKGHRKEEMR